MELLSQVFRVHLVYPKFGKMFFIEHAERVEVEVPRVTRPVAKILFCYRVSLKKGTFLVFCLFSILEVGFYFFACVSESEFRARFI